MAGRKLRASDVVKDVFGQQYVAEVSSKRKIPQKSSKSQSKRTQTKGPQYVHDKTLNEDADSIDCFSSSDDNDDQSQEPDPLLIGTPASLSQISISDASDFSSQTEKPQQTQSPVNSTKDELLLNSLKEIQWQDLSGFNDDDILSDVSDKSPGITQDNYSNNKVGSLPVPFKNHEDIQKDVNLANEDVTLIADHSSDEEEVAKCREADSAKRSKRKYSRTGYASQLRKILSREKSNLSFWLHSRQANTNASKEGGHSEEGVLHVTVNQIHECASVMVYECTKEDCNRDEDHRRLYVIMPAEHHKRHGIVSGCEIKLCRPWKEIALDSRNIRVIICAYFIEVTPPRSESSSRGIPTDGSLLDEMEHTHERRVSSPPIHPIENTSSDRVNGFTISRAIETRALAGRISFHAVLRRVFVERQRKCNIADSSSTERFGDYLKGRLTSSSCQHENAYYALVQDCELVLARIEFANEESINRWQSVLRNDGNVFHLKDLHVKKRIIRSKDIRMFSLIDHLNPGTKKVSRQSSQHSTPPLASTQLVQDWNASAGLASQRQQCYYQLVIDELSSFRHVPDTDIYAEEMLSDASQSLQRLSQLEEHHHLLNLQRISFYAYCICIFPTKTESSSQDNSSPCYLHVCVVSPEDDVSEPGVHQRQSTMDQNGQNMFRLLKLSQCYMSDVVASKMELERSVMKFADVLCSKPTSEGSSGDTFDFVLDKFSKITLCCDEDSPTCRLADSFFMIENVTVVGNWVKCLPAPVFRLPPLAISSVARGSLVSVSGVVCGVNEEKATMWNVCGSCKGTAFSKSNETYCLTCDKEVALRVSIELELFLHVASLSNCVVSVQLLQSSTEDLLPSLSSVAEGLDVNCILQKKISRLPCVVESNTVKRTQTGICNFISLLNVKLLMEPTTVDFDCNTI